MQGLERDRFALLTKTHHAMVDGISGVDIGTVLFDLEPVPAPAPVEERWVPQKSPWTAELVGRGIGDAIGMPIKLAGRAVEAVRHPESDGAQGGRGARGADRGLRPVRRPGAGRAAEPRDRAAPPLHLGALGAGDLQADQGQPRRHRQRRRPRRRHRLDPRLAALARRAHRGARAAGAGAGLDPRRGRARQPRQPDHGDARAAAGLHRGPGAAPAGDQRGDGRAEGIQTGAGRRNDLPLQRLRAADPARPGLAPQLQHPPLQPPRHQRAGPAGPPLRPGTGTGRGLPGRLPAAEPRASRWRS